MIIFRKALENKRARDKWNLEEGKKKVKEQSNRRRKTEKKNGRKIKWIPVKQ